jgi:plasmid stability protein
MSTAPDPVAHVSFKMPQSLVDELRLVAKENDRSLSAEARLALRAWLAKTEKAA